MKIQSKKFRAKEGEVVDLGQWPTRIAPVYQSKEDYALLLNEHVARLSKQQELLYASNDHALLLIFQAMDAAGKDGAIKHVMSGINPQGCQVFSFKHPSATELQHDFLWRTTRDLPERGRIGIFNRSYYEEVLIARVHPDIILSEGIPGGQRTRRNSGAAATSPSSIWRGIFTRNGTRIVKFFLHLSKEEQRKRFLARIDEPEKNWKFSLDDVNERHYWSRYMRAYEKCIGATSTGHAPWYIVPADDKANCAADHFPDRAGHAGGSRHALSESERQARRRELQAIRKKLK